MKMLEGAYNDQFTPSGPEAYIDASDSRFKAVHVSGTHFTDPGTKLSEL